jgi:DNA repair photolyase
MTKKKFFYSSKTGIARTEGFRHKMLADYSVNIGNICEFGCSFCYVPAVTSKQKTVSSILDTGYLIGEFSSYRYRENVLEQVRTDLKKIGHEEQGTVFFCTTCDPCATMDHAETSIEAIRLIMENSNLQVRVLSKCTLIVHIAESLSNYRERVMYSLSTGTSIPEISKAIEANASPIENRVEALHILQDQNYRTYGMICPVLPSETSRAHTLLDQVRPERCEGVWVEAINVRGKSLVNTYDKLVEAGLKDHAVELQRVMSSKAQWIEYSKLLFMSFQSDMINRGLIDKLHFLQYVSDGDKDFFQGQKGAVCL